MGAVRPQMCASVHLFESPAAEMYVHVSDVCPDVTRSAWVCATRGCMCTHWEGDGLIPKQITSITTASKGAAESYTTALVFVCFLQQYYIIYNYFRQKNSLRIYF